MLPCRLVDRNTERGTVLIMTLSIMLGLAIVVFGTMGQTPVREKMTAMYQERETAFRAAESAFSHAESYLDSQNFVPEQFVTEGLTCGSNCFTDQCTNGLCSSVSYENGGKCVHKEPDTGPFWADEDNWDNAAKHIVVSTSIPSSEPPKYIIEFLCHVPTNAALTEPSGSTYGAGWSYMFRVTVRAKGVAGSASVMLQTTFKKPI